MKLVNKYSLELYVKTYGFKSHFLYLALNL